MRIHAFTGTRYSRSDAAGSYAGPPYDQIDDTLRDRLHRRPHHFAHLTRPQAAAGNPHQAAAELYRRWLETGVLVRDPAPALYPYQIRLAEGGRRLGVCGLVGLELAASGIIRPHEATMAKTVDERLSLLHALRVDLEPILLLAEDKGALNRLLEEDLADGPPLVRHRDPAGNQHMLYRLDEPDRVARYRDLLSSCAGLIADGHHRYTVAGRYADERRAVPGTAAAAKLSVVTSLSSPGLRIDPIHRALRVPIATPSAHHLASARSRLSEGSGSAIVAAVAAAAQPALALAGPGAAAEIWRFDAERAPDSLPHFLRRLAVGWLHGALLPELGLSSAADADGTVQYRSDPDRLYSELTRGRASFAFWLPPMSPRDFARATATGQLLPPKSTRFLPKVVSGLVWAEHDCELA